MSSNRHSEYTLQSSSSGEPSKRSDNVKRSLIQQRIFDIDAQNRRLESKILAVKSRFPQTLYRKPVEKSNWAINQERRAKEIMRENQLISTRIKNAKSTIKK